MARRSMRRTAATDPASPCPCGLGEPYDRCCGRFHRGQQMAATAELLMRSRFSAFAVSDAAYLLRTWHSTTRPPQIQFDPGQRWTRLEVLGTTGGGLLGAEGTVEFRAHYSQRGQVGVMQERVSQERVLQEHSRFVRHNGLWVYLGPLPPARPRREA